MAILTIYGDQVASDFSLGDKTSTTTDWEVSQTPFLSTDIVRIEIRDSSLDANGEFDPDLVEYKSFSVERDGIIYEFGVNSGDKIKESSDGSNPEQGDTFFITNDSVAPPSSGPFAGLDEQQYLVSVDGSFSAGPGTYRLDRFTDVDLNGDGDTSDAAETGDGNFNIGAGDSVGLLCFVAGTMIATPDGERPVEDLREGQEVLTLDHGKQKILWIHSRTLNWDQGPSKNMPVRFEPGSLGDGVPKRTLDVSPQHRMLAKGHPEFGEVLLPAKSLVALKGVRQQRSVRSTNYVHILFENHEILFAEGARAESLLLREPFLETLTEAQKKSICVNMKLSCDQGDVLMFPPAARNLLTVQKAKQAIGHTLQF